MSYTVNVAGNKVDAAKLSGYHAYYANGVTAIETKENEENAAMNIGETFGEVLYVFE